MRPPVSRTSNRGKLCPWDGFRFSWSRPAETLNKKNQIKGSLKYASMETVKTILSTCGSWWKENIYRRVYRSINWRVMMGSATMSSHNNCELIFSSVKKKSSRKDYLGCWLTLEMNCFHDRSCFLNLTPISFPLTGRTIALHGSASTTRLHKKDEHSWLWH